ncbi:hypothetical protein CRUP_013140 [Coryphaenoides rupestris]|nr:hypothetical protein CRUP_013140 [Coryphaenoides rupestris]
MPVPTRTEPPALDHQTRFQTAVDVIQSLPKNGSYRPSYAVMLRFYSLYKQAVCGPCTLTRPGFWDPVGRYKWDAWHHLGGMSSEAAMEAYVDEMKSVAKEVVDTMPVDEKTASFLGYFDPLYLVVEDMPRPPQALLKLRPSDAEVCEGQSPTSDTESEIFCDTLDSEEQLLRIKARLNKSNGVQNGHAHSDPDASSFQPRGNRTVARATQVGSGQGGEGAGGEDRGPPRRRRSHSGRDGPDQSWRERDALPPGGPGEAPGRGAPNAGGGGGANGGGGRAGPEGGAERLHDAQLQQQIVVALRRLREDMCSVMERLEAVERLAAAHEVKWWPFEVSGHTLLLLLLWPLAAQGLLLLLRRSQKRGCVSS